MRSISSLFADLMTYGDSEEVAYGDEEVAEGQVHDGPLRVLEPGGGWQEEEEGGRWWRKEKEGGRL